ncbi:dihydrofolate reductase [Pseudomonas aeruginosa]|nr:dihydrofolate reductase [Pseudomonas aeruginosa]
MQGGALVGHRELRVAAALGENRAIGIDNRLPWRLPADLKHFKAMTLGNPIQRQR